VWRFCGRRAGNAVSKEATPRAKFPEIFRREWEGFAQCRPGFRLSIQRSRVRIPSSPPKHTAGPVAPQARFCPPNVPFAGYCPFAVPSTSARVAASVRVSAARTSSSLTMRYRNKRRTAMVGSQRWVLANQAAVSLTVGPPGSRGAHDSRDAGGPARPVPQSSARPRRREAAGRPPEPNSRSPVPRARASSSGVRPFRTSSMARCGNSAGYGRWLFGIVDAPSAPTVGRPRNRVYAEFGAMRSARAALERSASKH